MGLKEVEEAPGAFRLELAELRQLRFAEGVLRMGGVKD